MNKEPKLYDQRTAQALGSGSISIYNLFFIFILAIDQKMYRDFS